MDEHFTYHSKLLKRMKCKLTTITPCHIGSGNTLNRNVDFVSDGESLGVIDPRKIFDIVGESGIAGWCSVIDSQGDIMQYLRGVCPDVKIQDISSRLLKIQVGNSNVTGLREQISTLGTPYIPGSSIKGAIVSAILASKDSISIPRDIRKNNGVVDKVFSAREEGRNGRVQFDPKTSVLRFLRVGDALFDDVPTIAVYCYSLNIRESKTNLKVEKGHQYVEVISTGTAAEFDIDIKSEYLQKVQSHKTPLGPIPAAMTSLSELLRCINAHTTSLLKRELEAWKVYDYLELNKYIPQIKNLINECNKACRDGRSAVMRLGYGSGWNFITGGWSKLSATDKEWNRVVDKARPNNKSYQGYMFPKTRRTFDSYLPLGFVRIDIAE